MTGGFTRHPRRADLDAWRDLVKAAREAASKPEAPCKRLHKVARKANGAVLPVDHQRQDSPFVQLVRLADRFGLVLAAERAGPAGELKRLADLVDAAVGPAPGGPAKPANRVRARADIDG